MRVISLVPSWTETLLVCGVEVVGRTRFCIHPEKLILNIPAIGGTKDVTWDKLNSLSADLLVLDKEENPLEMAEKSPIEYLATHITSVHDVGAELIRISERLVIGGANDASEKLKKLAERWEIVCKTPISQMSDSKHLPGVLEWLIDIPEKALAEDSNKQNNTVYVIWKQPYMAVGANTFIASVLEKIGIPQSTLWPKDSGKYPEFSIDNAPSDALLLFSSEPYPFFKKRPTPVEIGGRSAAIVDGECFSWFGVRTLVFLEKALGIF